jgi:hypothetical protein
MRLKLQAGARAVADPPPRPQLIDAPLCYLAFVAYLRGWVCRKLLEIVIASSHIVGTVMFMGTKLY